MKIVMSNKIFLYYENEIEKDELRRILSEELTFVDPKTNLNFGKFANINKIVCYYHDSKEKFFEIPRGRFQILDKLAINSKIKINDYKDLRESGIEANIKCNFNFRDDIQKNAFESYINNPSKIGMINLACGLGEQIVKTMKLYVKL